MCLEKRREHSPSDRRLYSSDVTVVVVVAEQADAVQRSVIPAALRRLHLGNTNRDLMSSLTL